MRPADRRPSSSRRNQRAPIRLLGAFGCLAVLILTSSAGMADDLSGAPGIKLDIGVGASLLKLPETRLTLTREFFPAHTIAKREDHDGEFVAPRVDLSLTGRLSPGLSLRLSGFYGAYGSTQVTSCTPTLTVRCGVTSIVDDPLDPFQATHAYTLATSNGMLVTADRNAYAWGLSLATQLSGTGTWWKPVFGIDHRRIDQDMRIDVLVDNSPIFWPTTVAHYRETLDTSYTGVFVGGRSSTIRLLPRLTLSFGGTAGLYHARSSYTGSYSSVSGHPYADSAQLSLSRTSLAVIGTGDAELSARLSSLLTVSLYGKIEAYSWAPRMQYNDGDRDAVFALNAINYGTRIGDGMAYTLVGGLKLSAQW